MVSFAQFQIFRHLERPAEIERLAELKTIVKTERERFVNVILNNTDINNLDELLKFELSKYEAVSSLNNTMEAGMGEKSEIKLSVYHKVVIV